MSAPTGHSKIGVGSVVRLKSGGPPMVVNRTYVWDHTPGTGLHCVWIADDGTPQDREFHRDAVVPAPEDAPVGFTPPSKDCKCSS